MSVVEASDAAAVSADPVLLIPVGARLREVRKARGMRLKELPWPHTYTLRVERTSVTPMLDRLSRWCEALGITLRELLSSDDEWMAIRETCVLRDPFITEAAEDLLNLRIEQRGQVLDVLRELSERG